MLLTDNEPEVRLAAVDNIAHCLNYISIEKFYNLIMPTLSNGYQDGNNQFKASVANALSHIAEHVGKDMTEAKIIPILGELLTVEYADCSINVVEGLKKIAPIVGLDCIINNFFTKLS